MPLALVPNLATKWHHLHQLQIWPPDGASCISVKFFTNVTLWSELVQKKEFPKIGLNQVATFAMNEIRQVSDPKAWVCCASGNVFLTHMAMLQNCPWKQFFLLLRLLWLCLVHLIIKQTLWYFLLLHKYRRVVHCTLYSLVKLVQHY